MKVQRFRRTWVYGRAGVLHGLWDGSPVLRGQSSWRTVSGFFINTDRTGMVCVEFRHYRKGRSS